jgi:hypothetical protein
VVLAHSERSEESLHLLSRFAQTLTAKAHALTISEQGNHLLRFREPQSSRFPASHTYRVHILRRVTLCQQILPLADQR